MLEEEDWMLEEEDAISFSGFWAWTGRQDVTGPCFCLLLLESS